MSDELKTLIIWSGHFGLYATVVGLAVMLLMPGRVGHKLGGHMAILGGIVMAYEMVLSRIS
jgi:hypothetical protein